MPQHRKDGSNIGIASGTWNEEVEADNVRQPKLEVGMRWAEIVEDEILYTSMTVPFIGGASLTIAFQAGLSNVAGFQPAWDQTLFVSSHEEVEFAVPVDQNLRAFVGVARPNSTQRSVSIAENGEPGLPAGVSWVARQLFLGPSPGATAEVYVVGFDNRGKLIEERLPAVGAASVFTYVTVLGFRVVVPVPGDSWQIDIGNGVGLHYPIAGDEEAVLVQGGVSSTSFSASTPDGLITGPLAGTVTPPVPGGEPRGVYFPPFNPLFRMNRARLYYLASRVDQTEA